MFIRKRNHIQTHIDTHEGEHISVYAGSPLNSTPPVNDKLYGLTIYGNSTQDGIPTPENPIEIKSVPSTFNLSVCGSNFFNKLTNYRQNVSAFTDFGEYIRITGNDWGITGVSNWNNGWYTPNANLVAAEYNQPKLKYGDVITVSVDIRLVELGKGAQSAIHLYSRSANDGQVSSAQSLIPNEWVRLSQSFTITSADLIDKDDYYPIITLGSNTLDIKNIAIKYGTDSIYTPFKGVTTEIKIKDIDNNLYELCSNGDTADEVSGGKIIKRIDTDTNAVLATPIMYDLHPESIAALKSVRTIQKYTQIFTDATVQPKISCGIRKLGNRPFITAKLKDELGNFLVDENGNNIGGLY